MANRVHYDDTWNLDRTIARFVLPRLRRLREVKRGVPADFANRGTWEQQQEDWDAVLQRMILAFELVADDSGVPYDQLYDPPLDVEDDKDFSQALNDPERVSRTGLEWLHAIEDDRERLVSEGLMLFAIYYRALWD